MTKYDSYLPGQFCWIDLAALDMAKAEEFYTGLFGWKTQRVDTEGGPPYANFMLGESIVAGLGELNDEMRAQGIPPMWNSYISVDNVDKCAEKTVELGGQVAVPPMDVLHFGRLAFIQDKTGGMVGLWQPGDHIGATEVNSPNCFCWNEFATRDLAGACEFFEKLLGWSFTNNAYSPAPYMVIHCGENQNGGIIEMGEQWPENIPPHWSVYFTAASIEDSTKKLTGLGGKMHHGPFETPVGPMAICADPQGAMFNLIELNDAEMG